MKYFNCSMTSSLFSSFQENTKCESLFFRRYMYASRTYFYMCDDSLSRKTPSCV